MQSAADQLRIFYRSGMTRPLDRRLLALKNLRTAIEKNEGAILAALHEDLGKSPFEAYATEVAPVLAEADAFIKHAKKWLRAEKVRSPLLMFPAKTKVVRDPHGVVLLLSPWNYPFHLFMVPFIGMIACGNVVLGKPSRRSPATTAVIKKIIESVFPSDWVRVETEVALDDFYDYIFFTGGIETGKLIAANAAKHLTPVTLELGGKNACVVDASADLTVASRRIAWAKCTNAGQTCVAPDYLLVQKQVKDELVEKIAAEIEAQYGKRPAFSDDFGKIVSRAEYDRLLSLETDGTILKKIGDDNSEGQKLAPVIMAAEDGDKAMQREVFGPILPVVTWETEEELNQKIQATPLALYIYSAREAFSASLMQNHPSGGVCINDSGIQVANGHAPFGGVGTSGRGQYHGRFSADTFTRKKTVVSRGTKPDIRLRYAPYTEKTFSLMKKWRGKIF